MLSTLDHKKIVEDFQSSIFLFSNRPHHVFVVHILMICIYRYFTSHLRHIGVRCEHPFCLNTCSTSIHNILHYNCVIYGV